MTYRHYMCDCHCEAHDIEVAANSQEDAEERALEELSNMMYYSDGRLECYCECEEAW